VTTTATWAERFLASRIDIDRTIIRFGEAVLVWSRCGPDSRERARARIVVRARDSTA
jgi:uncharacterized protein YheU (UPF0270 family)